MNFVELVKEWKWVSTFRQMVDDILTRIPSDGSVMLLQPCSYLFTNHYGLGFGLV
jgi:hypothetical protein